MESMDTSAPNTTGAISLLMIQIPVSPVGMSLYVTVMTGI